VRLTPVVALVLFPPFAAGCGGSSAPPTPTATTVQLVYVSPPPPATISPDAGMCMHHGAPAGLVVAHPAWGAADLRLKEVENEPRTWGGVLEVRVGQEVRVAVRDIFMCYVQPQPADGLWVRSGLSVNGVAITRILPLSATEPTVPAFAFTVDANGTVE
jgi:hypothetical protein